MIEIIDLAAQRAHATYHQESGMPAPAWEDVSDADRRTWRATSIAALSALDMYKIQTIASAIAAAYRQIQPTLLLYGQLVTEISNHQDTYHVDLDLANGQPL